MPTVTIPRKLTEDDLIVVPKKEYERLSKIVNAISNDQVWFWTKEWQKKEREADEDINQSRISKAFGTKRELKAALRKLKK